MNPSDLRIPPRTPEVGEEVEHANEIERSRKLTDDARSARDQFSQTAVAITETWRELLESREGMFADREMRRAALNLLEDTELARRREEEETANRERAEAAERESEARYRRLFESIDEAFCIIEIIFSADEAFAVDYRFIEVNPAFERHTGLVGATGRTLRELLPAQEEHWFRIYGDIARTGEPARFEERSEVLGRDYDVYAFRIGLAGERRVAVLFTDISVRKRHERNLSFLAEISADLVGLASVEDAMDLLGVKIGSHFKVSLCAFSVIDSTAESLTTTHAWNRPGVPDTMGRHRIRDYHHNGEFVRVSRAGELFVVTDSKSDPRLNREKIAALWAGAFVSVPLLRDGEWRFSLSIADTAPRDWRDDEMELLQEITTRIWTRLERARAEAELSESEGKYRMLFGAVDEGFCLMRVLYDEQDRPVDLMYLEANPVFISQMGLEDPVGRTVSEVAADFDPAWIRAVAGVVATGESLRAEYHREATGRWFNILISGVEGPEKAVVAVVASDITEHKARVASLALVAEVSAGFSSSGDWRDLLAQVSGSIRRHFRFAVVELVEFRAGEGEAVVLHRGVAENAGTMVGNGAGRFSETELGTLEAGGVVAIERAVGGRNGEVESVLAAPHVADGELRFMIVGRRLGETGWREDEADLLREVAAHIYLRVERARANTALQQAHDQLDTRVRERTAELAGTLRQLESEVAAREEVEGQRAELLQRMMGTQEEERLRISRDLHDNLGQHMVAVMLGLDSLARLEGAPAGFGEKLQDLRQRMETFNQAVRRQAWELRPAEIEHLGIEAALRHYIVDWSGRTGIDAPFVCEGGDPPVMEADEMITLYRVMQEALTNIQRHASASSAVVQLDFTPRVRLNIEDDGVGFNAGHVKGRLGIVGMRERLLIVGGELEIQSAPGEGTRIIATLGKVPEERC